MNQLTVVFLLLSPLTLFATSSSGFNADAHLGVENSSESTEKFDDDPLAHQLAVHELASGTSQMNSNSLPLNEDMLDDLVYIMSMLGRLVEYEKSKLVEIIYEASKICSLGENAEAEQMKGLIAQLLAMRESVFQTFEKAKWDKFIDPLTSTPEDQLYHLWSSENLVTEIESNFYLFRKFSQQWKIMDAKAGPEKPSPELLDKFIRRQTQNLVTKFLDDGEPEEILEKVLKKLYHNPSSDVDGNIMAEIQKQKSEKIQADAISRFQKQMLMNEGTATNKGFYRPRSELSIPEYNNVQEGYRGG